jgi:predicted metal-dependent hydrolase
MKRILEYGSYEYEYFVEFSDRKTMTLVVRPDLRIVARVPVGTETGEIEDLMKRKWRWMSKQLAELSRYHKTNREKQYISGESYYYLGRQYTLLVEAGEDEVKLERGRLRIYTSKNLRDSGYNKKLLEGWFENRRNIVFNKEYQRAVKLFNFEEIPKLRTRIMARRWGSYTVDDKVSLNPKLIQAPREAIFYVCIHELCHKISRKHDQVFYDELEKRLPNWRQIKESLEIRHG